MNRSTVRSGGLLLTAALAGSALLACGGADRGDGDRRTVAGDTVAETPFAPGEGLPGATPAPGDGPFDAPAANGEDPVTDAPGGTPPAPARPGATTDGATTGGAGQAPSPSPTTGSGATSPAATAPGATPPAGRQAVSTDGILQATARTYERVRSMQAEFEQQMRNPLLGQTTRSSGTLYQRQPDRFLMQFSDPEGDVIVSDGQYFWLYYPSVDARQVIRTPRGPQGLDLHAQFIGDPVRRFEATSHGREAVRGRDAHVLTLVPREPLGYRSLKVWVDAEDHLVRRFELTEENGNVRQFELRNVVVNPSLPDRLFQFTPPAGAQVITR
jgi:outer membrane lipoprotein carrier protein